uniref:Integrase n=1 Tax=Haemonchus placei TaxID=6290 RepID=A0A158QLX2_HAEPC
LDHIRDDIISERFKVTPIPDKMRDLASGGSPVTCVETKQCWFNWPQL